MDKIQKLIEDACDDMEGVSFRIDYSGRSMRGNPCIGVVGTWSKIQKLIAEVLKGAADELHSVTIDADSEEEMRESYNVQNAVHELIEQIMDYSWDSMGYDVIVYWPRIEPLDDEDEDED